MGKASDWLREERRKVLGDWVAVCLRCGAAQRYFEETEDELPAACVACGGELLARCPACDARFSSAFAVEVRGVRRSRFGPRSNSASRSANRRRICRTSSKEGS